MRSFTSLVLACASVFVGCGANPPATQSNTRPQQCSVPSCCGGGWVFSYIACVPLQPPACGCACDDGVPPTVYATREQCLAAHPH
ncbi:MAG: hypothetical protein IPK60_13640 [Sandaracinaceae bacterium]|nr:hypothetical protein [Sandaracinaceae bacterium]